MSHCDPALVAVPLGISACYLLWLTYLCSLKDKNIKKLRDLCREAIRIGEGLHDKAYPEVKP